MADVARIAVTRESGTLAFRPVTVPGDYLVYYLPFQMTEKGGNPWRGMLFGMANRLLLAGDPRPLWKAWDAFGLGGAA